MLKFYDCSSDLLISPFLLGTPRDKLTRNGPGLVYRTRCLGLFHGIKLVPRRLCGAWINGLHICFPSLPPMLLCGFESHLKLASSDFSMWHFLKLVARGFLRVLRFPPLLNRLMVQPPPPLLSKQNKQTNKQTKTPQIIAILTLSSIIAELSLRIPWHVTRYVERDKRSMCCT